MDEHLFQGALIRERRRADRFEQTFTVLTVTADHDGSSSLAEALKATAAHAGGAAIIGWIRRHQEFGAILPDLGARAPSVARALEARLQDHLEAVPGIGGRLSIRFQTYRGPRILGSGEPIDANQFGPASSVAGGPPWRDRTKRAADFVGSLALMAVLSPAFVLIALAIKLTSSGPVLFRQVRVGEGARPFTMLKFRTMQAGADPALHRQYVAGFITSTSEAASEPDGGSIFKITNDPRVTPLGRFLRGTSLDELPQFWNVLKGEMSLVGPRPPLPYEIENYRRWHWGRVLDATPGLTGLWQVIGRSRTTFDQMVRLDLRYARTRSFWLDLKILLMTPLTVITGKGAW